MRLCLRDRRKEWEKSIVHGKNCNRKLFWAAHKEGTAIDGHIRMLITYQEESIGLGQTLDDAKFAITLLTSLPESWNNFIARIDRLF